MAGLVVLACVRWLLAEIYLIPSVSMYPAIIPNDVILVNKLAFGLRLPFSNRWLYQRDNLKPGQIVVFKAPIEQGGEILIKRLIGISGDQISFSDNGRIAINDKFLSWRGLDELSINKEAGFASDQLQFFSESLKGLEYTVAIVPNTGRAFERPYSISHDQFFFMGDNRDYSVDSRYWGTIPRTSLIGRPIIVLWNCRHADPMFGLFCWPWDLRYNRSGVRLL